MSGADINLGVHGGGHFSLGPALLDFFASPAILRFTFMAISIASGRFGKRRIQGRGKLR